MLPIGERQYVVAPDIDSHITNQVDHTRLIIELLERVLTLVYPIFMPRGAPTGAWDITIFLSGTLNLPLKCGSVREFHASTILLDYSIIVAAHIYTCYSRLAG